MKLELNVKWRKVIEIQIYIKAKELNAFDFIFKVFFLNYSSYFRIFFGYF